MISYCHVLKEMRINNISAIFLASLTSLVCNSQIIIAAVLHRSDTIYFM